MDVTPNDVIGVMQSRFPHELEICVLTAQVQKLQAELEAAAAVDAEDTAD
jgi:hypothetical protein